MKLTLHFITILSGLVLIGVAVALMQGVDAELHLKEPKPREQQGFATAPRQPIESPGIDARSATRLTILGSAVALLGAGNVMIGSLLIGAHLLETRAMRSRLGTDQPSTARQRP